MARVFFSYSHADEGLRDRLEKSLAMLQHEGLIEAWHDCCILAVDEFDDELEKVDIILLLASPDFLASRYCRAVEVTRAMERHAKGAARVIPVILRPCEWATRRLHSQGASRGGLERTPSARRLARLLLLGRTQLARVEAVLVATIESALPSLAKARELVERFQAMIGGRKDETLAAWIDAAMASPLASFAGGIRADQNAVAAAIVEPWSNGQTEGQITKLKLVKRQMFGRAKLDLLRACLVAAG